MAVCTDIWKTQVTCKILSKIATENSCNWFILVNLEAF